MTVTIDEIEHAFAWQVDWCEKLGSPFTATLLQIALDDIKARGTTFDLMGMWPRPPIEEALALRFSGALNALVLAGKVPDLAALYPAQTDQVSEAVLGAVMRQVMDTHKDFIAAFLERPVQTNEIGRSACLLPGFLTLCGLTDRPLHLAEIGASAGLNLLWDRFHYDFGEGREWGGADSPVQLKPNWKGGVPDLARTPNVASRTGVDINPLDLSTEDAITAASAYIWPDQLERLERFRAAAHMLNELRLSVEKGDAAAWIDTQIADRPADGALVIYHSIMWQYMPDETQDHITQAIEAAGEAATKNAPIAWLFLEPENGKGYPEVRLRYWGGDTPYNERLAWAHPHGTDVEWLKDTP